MTLKRLCGKIALVTGSTTGIGYAIAERLAQEGAKVLISSRSTHLVEEATKKLREKQLDVIGRTCNVSDHDQRKKLLEEAERYGGLDIFVNTVAANPKVAICGIYDCPDSAWDKIMDVNVKTSFLFTKEALPLLRKSKSGRIIYIGSVVSKCLKMDLGAYMVSKTALACLARIGGAHLGSENITVNCVAPGIIETKFAEILMADKDEHLKRMSIKRFGEPEDVSGVVAFLASDDGRFVTGETICVDGGAY